MTSSLPPIRHSSSYKYSVRKVVIQIWGERDVDRRSALRSHGPITASFLSASSRTYLVHIACQALPYPIDSTPPRRLPLLVGIEIDDATPPDHALTIIQRPRPDIGIKSPIILIQASRQLIPLPGQLGRIIRTPRDPFKGLPLQLPKRGRPLRLQPLPRIHILHHLVLALHRLFVPIVPLLASAQLPHDLTPGDEDLEILDGFRKVDLGSDDGIQPALDDGPDALEDPGGFVDEDRAEGFGVVGLEDFDHESERGVVHVGEGEGCHVEDDRLR